MRLISCRLQNVRRHRSLELSFGRQLTLIAGANESGKSTLVEALHKGLFLRATATGRGVDELRSRLHAGLPEVEIRFEAEADTWRLRKRFAGAGGTCQLSSASGEALSGPAAEERLAALLGFEAPVEGRRIAQLPERWAHLWVRQGDAGLNPLSGNQERYDHNRLVEQLQRQGTSTALESGVDQLVLELIQQQVAELYTATGRVKAGSPLAEAQRRSSDTQQALEIAQQHLADLESAMEQWRSLNERLETIERDLRPALQLELELQRSINLLQAQLQPLLQQQQERDQLLQQQQQGLQEQELLQEQLAALVKQHDNQSKQRDQRVGQRQELSAQLQQLTQRQELLQLLLDLQQLEAEAQQCREHQHKLQQLQAEAELHKQQLSALPEITADQVRQLRQAEQALAQATARREAMAASLEVLNSDQTIVLNGAILNRGERQRLEAPAQLQVGNGVLLEIRPGGGEALSQALAQQQSCQQQLAQLQHSLNLNNSEQAETIERERQRLERDLNNLRQAAKSIPWSGLQQRLDQLEPRRQTLLQALSHHQPLLNSMAEELGSSELEHLDPVRLHSLQEQLRRDNRGRNQELETCNRALQGLEQLLQGQQATLVQHRNRQAELAGSQKVVSQRLQTLSELKPQDEALKRQQEELQRCESELQRLRAGRSDADAADQLLALEQEKDQLLSQRGQTEQRCQSLGSNNPIAELEHRQAAWEDAEAERRQLEQRGQSLQLLLERFHQEQSNLAARYSEPLQAAITPYLSALTIGENRDVQHPLVAFDPQHGFHDLQLHQGEEAFAFERLSGGMREQMAAAVRLAMAELLKPAYGNVLPLVFDDAFTNSDRQRQNGLKQMLLHGIDQGIQIVLLTCHSDDYRSLLNDVQKNPPEVVGGTELNLVTLH
jgi:DNA repair exonuclease SbcCD ATPase subunit